MQSSWVPVMLGAFLLTACGGGAQSGGGGGGASSSSVAGSVDYTKLTVTPQSDQVLELASGQALERHIENGLRLALRQSTVYSGAPVAGLPQPAETTNTVADGATSDNFSQTNVRVTGVDEADYAKYDGKHWFVATYPEYEPYRIDNFPGINIVATDPEAPNAEVVSHFSLDNQWGGVSEMYLVADGDLTTHVAALQNQWGNVYPILPGFGFPGIALPPGEVRALPAIEPFFGDIYYPYPVNSETKIQLIDVQNTTSPVADWELRLEGSLIDSRKVGNVLYLVTRFDPWIADLQFEGSSDSRSANEAILEGVGLPQLLPSYTINDEAPVALTDRCYVQKGLLDSYGYANLVHITAIDLGAKKVLSSECLNGSVEALSVTPTSLYITGSILKGYERSQTIIHKFSLDENGTAYVATGSVDGYLGQRGDPALRMHEYNGDFRIVTSSGNPWDFSIKHQLWVLEENNGRLNVVASLPNANHPDAIGKPGEDIYAVRFDGNKGYIVTFRQTDPLYAIDLSDRSDPKITGQLEVPGFASYLHPVSDNYLFAIGQDADTNGRVTSLKVALYDVSASTPREIDSYLLGASNSYSEALNNLRALSFLAVGDDELRIAMPVNYYQSTIANSYGDWRYTGLNLFNISGISTGNARLTEAGVIIAEQPSETQKYPLGSGNDRGIFHNDAIFYAHANSVWAAKWGAADSAVGPISGVPVLCTQELRPSLQVTLNAPGGNACEAKVQAVTAGEVYPLVGSGVGESCEFSGPFEIAGDFYLEASLDNFSTENANRVVYKDACHVITEQIDIDLISFEGGCPEEAGPSVQVILTTWFGADNFCNDASVTVTQNGVNYLLLPQNTTQTAGGSGSGSGSGSDSSVIAVPNIDGASIAPPQAQCIFAGAHGVVGQVDIIAKIPSLGSVTRDDIFIKRRDQCTAELITEYVFF